MSKASRLVLLSKYRQSRQIGRPVHQNRCGIFSICARLISPCKKHAHNKPVYPLNPVAVVQAECQGRKYRAGPEAKPAPKKSEQPQAECCLLKDRPEKKSCRKKRQASPGRHLRRLRIALPHKGRPGKIPYAKVACHTGQSSQRGQAGPSLRQKAPSVFHGLPCLSLMPVSLSV